ncbi:MAG TPA: UvrD-helicase domain-containing protein [Methylomirabilota bacterium]|nr:UvrD-helicase domain-containing protein [Methylomirabilota bacterium]
MSKPAPAPDQMVRDLVRDRLDVNLLVEAGAGSGKTECLAQRMAAGVLAGKYQVEAMAAVTFTRKAAAELRARFQLTLERALAGERDPARRKRAQHALRHLERLFTGTIHAFCAHLLRERPVEAGVAPGFTELDEIAQVDQRRRAWRDYLDRERGRGSATLQELLETGVRPADLDKAFDVVSDYAEVEFPTGAAPRPDPAPARDALERLWVGLKATLVGDFPEASTCKVQERMREFAGRLRVATLDEPRDLAGLMAMWERQPKIVQKWWPGGGKAAAAKIDTLFRAFHEVALPFLEAWYAYVYRLAVTLLVGGREFAADARRRAVSLNYGDLLQYAATLLREDPDVRAALQAKYRWLFVDEFQDTDPIQAEVMLLLAGAPSSERDWTRVPLRPGGLFVVGDPKQSIYRFRRADIDIYQQVRQRIVETGGLVVPLTACFRSVPALCEWANAAFGVLFPAAPTPQQPGFVGLVAARREKGSALGVRVIDVPEAVATNDAAAAFDAEVIARFIRSELDARRRKPGDFLILTRTRRALPIYTRALEALRLPVEVSGGAAFAQSAAVTGLADLLCALTDPDDGPAVVGVLRGPLLGLSDAALFRHRESGGGFLLTAPDVDGIAGPVGEALRALRRMYDWTRRLPAPAAVERVLEATGLLAMSSANSPGGAEAGDLFHAVDRIRQVTEHGGTLADAAEALIDDLSSADVESVPLEPGRTNVVRVMNLHKAKGLEARVVFLADPLRGWIDSIDTRIVRDGSRGLGYFQLTRERGRGQIPLARPEGWKEHQAQERVYQDAEQRRLVYVAATRAQDLLVISRPMKAGARTRPWQLLEPYLMKAPRLAVPPVAIPLPLAQPDLTAGARSAAEAARAARVTTLREAAWQVESVTGTAHRAGPYGHPLQEGKTREPDTGMAWGSLIHFLLEHALPGPRDRAHLERLALWFAFDRPELRRVIPEALDTVERVMAADFWQEALAAEERAVEVPFAVTVAAANAPPTLLHGVIDLAYRTRDGWTLIDYKTDQLTAGLDALAARYAPQIRAYAERWSAQLGAPTRAGLHFIRSGDTRWL